LMTFYLSIILDLQNFFHWYILLGSKLKRPQTQLRPHVLWLIPRIWQTGWLQFKNHKFSKYVQQYTSFSYIWRLHLAIDSLCKGQ
jgi:hypothetical protein